MSISQTNIPDEINDYLLALALDLSSLEDALEVEATNVSNERLTDFCMAALLQVEDERLFLNDVEIARSLAGLGVGSGNSASAIVGTRDQPLSSSRCSPKAQTTTSVASARNWSIASSSSNPPLPPQSTRPAASTPSCGACLSSSPGLFSLPCAHQFCQPCLLKLIETASKDVVMFPARCCGASISETLINDACKSNPKVLLDYRLMKQQKIEMVAANDALDAETVRNFEGEGLKRCPGCRFYIQKVDGCNHMRWVVTVDDVIRPSPPEITRTAVAPSAGNSFAGDVWLFGRHVGAELTD